MNLKHIKLICSKEELKQLPEGKLLINTINAFSYNNALKDEAFAEALLNGDALIPDGMSIVKACRKINADYQPKERIAGWDLFAFEMDRLNNQFSNNVETEEAEKTDYTGTVQQGEQRTKGRVMFFGSSEATLQKIVQKAAEAYPNLEVVTYSPPYKPEFSDEDNTAMINAINDAKPDLLWIGMTAPKQEKWTYKHWEEINIHCHCGTIGAVFDFFAGNTKRAPIWWQEHGLEWLYRLIKEPKRMWRRYIIGNAEFLWNISKIK